MTLENTGLEPEQEELLAALVEATRNVPSDQREAFHALRGDDRLQLFHPGLAGRVRQVLEGDIDVLRRESLVIASGSAYSVSARGFRYYEEMKRRSGQSFEMPERELTCRLSSERFQQSYPKASKKWAKAEAMLWAVDSREQFTAIGLYCREAMQDFADALVERYQPPEVDAAREHDVNRVAAVLDCRKACLGEKERALLDALLGYWRAVSGLAQRQVHKAGREGEALVWEDARRLVLQAALVMYEVDSSLSRAG